MVEKIFLPPGSHAHEDKQEGAGTHVSYRGIPPVIYFLQLGPKVPSYYRFTKGLI